MKIYDKIKATEKNDNLASTCEKYSRKYLHLCKENNLINRYILHREMPAIKLFGRKWLTATDDCVYPGLFEVFIRIAW